MEVAPLAELDALRLRVAELEAALGRRDTASPAEPFDRQWRIVDTALSHSPDSTYIFDPDGRLLYANKTLLNLWGKSLSEVVGRSLQQLGYPPDIARRAQAQIRQVAETREGVRDQVSLAVFTGTPRHYEYIFVPVLAADGSVEAVAGSTRDVTERQHSRSALEDVNAELRRARQQLVDIFENMTDAFFALDNDWCFTYVNRHAGKILFRTAEELLGKNIWEEFAPAVGSTFYHQYHRAKAENVPVEFEEFYAPLHTWFEVRAYPSADGLGVYFHNISGRRADQEVLRSQAEELTRINADLEHFAYAAAHDLQEPIRMVAIFSQLLEKKYAAKLDEEGRRYISHAVAGANRMERLVQDLLAYNRASSRDGVSQELVDAEKILKEVLSDMRSTIERAGAQIHFSALPLVFMDKVHLSQLFQNLIGNAIKYRSKDVPRIHISAVACGEMSRFSVEDNGIGIEPEYAEQVFGLFKRLHTNDEYEGTGIGLAICQKIVLRYGGRIWLESKPGYGSAFYFTVPA
jgi:PAS domain S-box-containing protein